MKPNEEKPFLKVELLESLAKFPISDSAEMVQIQNRIKILITYESMYGEKFTCT
jgi:hypothetical protein